MPAPADRRYTESHEWHKIEGDTLTLGLTQHAVDQLTDVTFVELKEAGTLIEAGDTVGEVESVKTTSDVYCAASGEIIETNAQLEDNPGLLNEDPYGEGWLVKLKVNDPAPIEALADSAKYDAEYAN
ncbi:MAG: glycine cleavage system H protein [Phycisphaerales bacterium]|jgi:glycine cleavage system H protein